MIKIGIVGAGINSKQHADAILANPDTELVMVADVVLQKAEALAKPHGAKAFADYKDFLKDEGQKPDVVILNLPHFLHCEVSVFFLSNGVNVLCEKPMAMNVKECDKMVLAAKEHNTKLGIGHVQQYFNTIEKVREIAQTNQLGRLIRITDTRNTNYFARRPEWFLDKKLSGGGMIMNYGAHTLDRIFYVMDSDVKKVNAVLSNYINEHSIEEGAQVLIEFENGVSATMNYSGGAVVPFQETVYYFEKGQAKVTNKLSIYDGKETTEIDSDGVCWATKEIAEMVEWLGGRATKITTPEYAGKIVSVIEQIAKNEVLR